MCLHYEELYHYIQCHPKLSYEENILTLVSHTSPQVVIWVIFRMLYRFSILGLFLVTYPSHDHRYDFY